MYLNSYVSLQYIYIADHPCTCSKPFFKHTLPSVPQTASRVCDKNPPRFKRGDDWGVGPDGWNGNLPLSQQQKRPQQSPRLGKFYLVMLLHSVVN